MMPLLSKHAKAKAKTKLFYSLFFLLVCFFLLLFNCPSFDSPSSRMSCKMHGMIIFNTYRCCSFCRVFIFFIFGFVCLRVCGTCTRSRPNATIVMNFPRYFQKTYDWSWCSDAACLWTTFNEQSHLKKKKIFFFNCRSLQITTLSDQFCSAYSCDWQPKIFMFFGKKVSR